MNEIVNRLIRTGNQLSIMAQRSGIGAGREPDVLAAVEAWHHAVNAAREWVRDVEEDAEGAIADLHTPLPTGVTKPPTEEELNKEFESRVKSGQFDPYRTVAGFKPSDPIPSQDEDPDKEGKFKAKPKSSL